MKKRLLPLMLAAVGAGILVTYGPHIWMDYRMRGDQSEVRLGRSTGVTYHGIATTVGYAFNAPGGTRHANEFTYPGDLLKGFFEGRDMPVQFLKDDPSVNRPDWIYYDRNERRGYVAIGGLLLVLGMALPFRKPPTRDTSASAAPEITEQPTDAENT